ncbi:rod shape-determining protein MreD [Parvibium lacunae]|uniref:Rod shape-determining protein MreD n=1 Tax=Parvibium lacunae TaxID=1888893 RepID=A0A368L4V0_9BURK|nr:rod shape-determining protein MreD [Parvibium lacunae]RCS58597.1 rod shape-determining protein MreD [Parvibium lacunae]
MNQHRQQRTAWAEPEYILLPANSAFIWFSLVIALLLNLLPWGRWPGVPDFLAVALVFWNVHQPRKVGMSGAFLFGLVMDVHQGVLLGQHALAYTLLSYAAISLHRRIVWFSLPTQSLHVLPLFLLAQAVVLLIHVLHGDGLPGWWFFMQGLAECILWPIATWLLLAPQRRAVDKDDVRPI